MLGLAWKLIRRVFVPWAIKKKMKKSFSDQPLHSWLGRFCHVRVRCGKSSPRMPTFLLLVFIPTFAASRTLTSRVLRRTRYKDERLNNPTRYKYSQIVCLSSGKPANFSDCPMLSLTACNKLHRQLGKRTSGEVSYNVHACTIVKDGVT